MAKLESLLSGVLKISESDITDEMSMSSLDTWDSLTHMEMIAGIEQDFGIELTRDDIVRMTDVATIRRVIDEKDAA